MRFVVRLYIHIYLYPIKKIITLFHVCLLFFNFLLKDRSAYQQLRIIWTKKEERRKKMKWLWTRERKKNTEEVWCKKLKQIKQMKRDRERERWGLYYYFILHDAFVFISFTFIIAMNFYVHIWNTVIQRYSILTVLLLYIW